MGTMNGLPDSVEDSPVCVGTQNLVDRVNLSREAVQCFLNRFANIHASTL